MIKKVLVTLFALGVTTAASAQYSKVIAVVSNKNTTDEQRILAVTAFKKGEKAEVTVNKDSTVFTYSYKKYEATVVDTDKKRFSSYQEKMKKTFSTKRKIIE